MERTIFLFSGSHNLDEIKDIDWTDYLINARLVKISFLAHDAAIEAGYKPHVKRFDIKYEPEHLADTLLQTLGDEPYLIQGTMFELVQLLNAAGRKTVSQSDIDSAVEKMFVSCDTYFFNHNLFDIDCDKDEQELLLRLANGKPVGENTEEIYRRRLIRKEIIRKAKGGYEFCVPVFALWLIKNH